jgi:hypothetical protein
MADEVTCMERRNELKHAPRQWMHEGPQVHQHGYVSSDVKNEGKKVLMS